MAAVSCSHCDSPLPEGSRFCMTCGADLSDPSVSTRTRAAAKELFEAIKIAVQGRYNVSDLLGRGGMGAVFLAEDLRLGRTVAIKVLRPDLATEGSFIGRFEREARIAAKLDHPNIIPIHSVEEVDGVHFFVMKYVAGKSVEELLSGQPWAIEHCRQVLWQAACGLGHAHQRSVIHRDIKPSNIMIDESGRAMITDFGISKALQQDTQYTSTGQVVGTPRYVSPEQAQGLPLDGRSDQYSLAVVGFQMLTGRLPLIAETVHALMYKHIYEVPPTVHSLRPEVPEDLSAALERALKKEPTERFATMEDFATAIWPERPVRAGLPTPTVGAFAPLARLMPRRRKINPAVLSTLAVSAALAVAFLLGRRSPGPPPTTESGTAAPVESAVSLPDVGAQGASGDSSTAVTPTPDPVVPPTRESTAVLAPGPPTTTDVPAPPKATPARRPRRTAPATPPPAVAPVPPATPALGFVTINALPYGTVTIDGVEVGDTPIVRRGLSPGEHTVSITRPGYRTEKLTVTVTAENEVRVSRSLLKAGE
jgi:serine/threonine protein kinase